MSKRFFIVILVFKFLFGIVHAQTPSISPTTPSIVGSNVGTTSLHGSNFNPDLFTGTVNVNVPIYDFNKDGLDLGISLNYNTLGIQVDQLASSVGLGWTLNAGGAITRKVNGVEDEIMYPGVGPVQRTSGLDINYYYFQNRPYFGSWCLGSTFNGTYSDNGVEHEPDVFTFNVGGKTFDFTIAYPGNSVAISTGKNVAVYVLINGNVVSTQLNDTMIDRNQYSDTISFKVIDEEGNQFFFNRGDYEYEPFVDTPDNLSYTFYPIDKWNVSKIITYSGATINYKYNHYDNVNYPEYLDVQIKEQKQLIGGTSALNSPAQFGGISISKNESHNWKGTLSQLSEIDYPDGIVAKFSAGADPTNPRMDLINTYAIDSIILQSGYDNNVWNHLTYRLNFAYFTQDPNNPELAYGPSSNSQNQLNYRLKLKGIDKIGTDNLTTETYYQFDYNNLLLPPRLSPAQDCYGYYNGATPSLSATRSGTDITSDMTNRGFGSLAVPYHLFEFEDELSNISDVTYGTLRNSNITYAQACLLNKVVNSLGAESHFFYKAHVLSSPPTSISGTSTLYYVSNTYFGLDASFDGTQLNPPNDLDFVNTPDGVCIDYISTYDGFNPGNQITTKYTFSGGLQFFSGGYTWYPTKIDRVPMNTTPASNTWFTRTYTNRIISPQDFINGCNHGYSDVTVVVYGNNNQIISNQHTHFTNVIEAANEVDSAIYDKPGMTQGSGPFHQGSYLMSRLRLTGGLMYHTMPEVQFYKNLVGLPIEIDNYDENNNLISQVVNRYNLSMGSGALSGQTSYRYFASNVVNGTAGLSTIQGYLPFIPSLPLEKTSVSTSYSGGSTSNSVKWYFYDDYDNLSQEIWNDSKGETYSNIYYNVYPSIAGTNLIMYHIGGMTRNKYVNGNWMTLGGSIVSYGNQSSFYLGTFGFNEAGTIAALQADNNVYTDWKYYTLFDIANNVIEAAYSGYQKYSSFFWDMRFGKKLATVTNSKFNDMAYTSFEGASGANGCNWTFSNSSVVYNASIKPMTGRYYYNFTGTSANIVSTNSLTSGKLYYVSFWANGDVPYVTVNPVIGIAPVTMTQQYTVNGWSLYTGYIVGTGAPLKLTYYNGLFPLGYTPACKLDELRLYPANASMETDTYEPLFGISSHCDDRNNIMYYEYDAIGNRKIVRDINGNIISYTKSVKKSTDN